MRRSSLRCVWWQEDQHTTCALLPTARTTLQSASDSTMPTECVRDRSSRVVAFLSARKLHSRNTAPPQQCRRRDLLPRQLRAADARGTWRAAARKKQVAERRRAPAGLQVDSLPEQQQRPPHPARPNSDRRTPSLRPILQGRARTAAKDVAFTGNTCLRLHVPQRMLQLRCRRLGRRALSTAPS